MLVENISKSNSSVAKPQVLKEQLRLYEIVFNVNTCSGITAFKEPRVISHF